MNDSSPELEHGAHLRRVGRTVSDVTDTSELIRLDGVAPVRVIWLGVALVLAFQVWMVARRFSARRFRSVT